MSVTERLLAFSDFKTTGPDSTLHEILEIGLVVVDPKTFRTTDHLSEKVRPEHLETAMPRALAQVCYNEFDWQGACLPEDALRHYAEKTKGAILCVSNRASNLFLQAAFSKTGVQNEMCLNSLDFWTMAWIKLHRAGLAKFTLGEVAQYFGIPKEPRPHRALQGALDLFEIYKRLTAL